MKKRLISLIMAVVMILSLCTVAFAAEATTTVTPSLPTDKDGNPASVEVSAPAGITSITVNGDAAVYHDDEPDVDSTIYIRAIDNGGSEYALRHATVEIRKIAGTTVSCTGITLTGSDTLLTATDVDLFNKAYTLVINGTSYVLAAGLPEGAIAIDPADPLAVTSATIGGANATITATNVQNPYMGNNEKTTVWTFVNYSLNASMTGSDIDRANIKATVSASSNASYSGCYNASANNMNLSGGAPAFVLTNDGTSRTYYVFATSPGTITIEYGIDFTEALNSTEYADDADVKAAVDYLISAAEGFFGVGTQGGAYGKRVVASGTTVMDIMHEFAEENGWGDEVPEGCTYMATLNGIGEFTFGSMSGWMYTTQPEWNKDRTADYMNKWYTPPIGAASYTLSDGDTICWFICCDYTHHPWN